MRHFILILFFALTATALRAEEVARPDPQGWHWYNEPQEQEDEPAAPPVNLLSPPQSPGGQKKRLQQATQAALDTAVLYPTTENVRRYMTLQQFWTERAGAFSQGVKRALLRHPELDYNLKFSHYNGTTGTQLAADRQQAQAAVSALSARYGVFFFYRGRETRDEQMAEVISNFSQAHRIALVPVSVDGVISPALPASLRDNGQSQRMGLQHFPALLLVDPKAGRWQPLAWGFITQDDLARQFLNVASDFAPNF